MNTTSIHEPMTNENVIEAWNTVLFHKFCRFKHLVTGLGIHGEAALGRHPPRHGSRIIDLGCGFGDMTISLSRSVGAAGEAVGVDVAERFVAAARVNRRRCPRFSAFASWGERQAVQAFGQGVHSETSLASGVRRAPCTSPQPRFEKRSSFSTLGNRWATGWLSGAPGIAAACPRSVDGHRTTA
jgi:hypothetical protein